MVRRPVDPPGVVRRPVERLGSGGAGEGPDDCVVVEEPLEIRVDGDTIGVTMRTPGDDTRLALGFLFGEGIVRTLADVGTVTHCGKPGQDGWGNVIEVRSGPGTSLAADRILEGRRFVPTTSACGVCGRQTIADLVARCGTVHGGASIASELVLRCMERMRAEQARFARTGGLHAAAAFDSAGELVCVFEDVGRHNATDKVVGELLRLGLVGEGAKGAVPALLVVSGRAGFEIVQKAAAAKIPIVASVSASTSLAIDLASSCGLTLVGFARGTSLNVYTHPWRIAAQGRLRSVPKMAPPGLEAADDPSVWFPTESEAPEPEAVGGGAIEQAKPDGPTRGPQAMDTQRLAPELLDRVLQRRQVPQRMAAGGKAVLAVDVLQPAAGDGIDPRQVAAWNDTPAPVSVPLPAPVRTRAAPAMREEVQAADPKPTPADAGPRAVLIDDRDPSNPSPVYWPGGWSTGRVR